MDKFEKWCAEQLLAREDGPTPRTDAIAPVGYARAQDLLLYREVWAGYSNKPADENGHPPVTLYTQDQVDVLLAALRAQLADYRAAYPAKE